MRAGQHRPAGPRQRGARGAPAHVVAVTAALALAGAVSSPLTDAGASHARVAEAPRPVIDSRALAGEGKLAFVSGRRLWVLSEADGLVSRRNSGGRTVWILYRELRSKGVLSGRDKPYDLADRRLAGITERLGYLLE